MATDLSIRFYFSRPSTSDAFAALVEALGESSMARHAWQGLDVVTRRPLQYRLRQTDPLTAKQVCAAARVVELGTDENMASQTSLRCWRRAGVEMTEGGVVAFVEAWGDDYGQLNGEDLRMMGRAAITLGHAGPFTADITGADAAYNDKVEANLEDLTALMVHLTNTLKPDAVKVFDDQGLYLPTNAHAAYFRNAAIVLDDIALLRQVWAQGLPLHKVDPLRAYKGDAQDGALHLLRTPEQRGALWARLSAALQYAPTVDDVIAVIASGRFDTLTKDDSFFVLEYPHYMNAFVDRFYLEVLEHAGGRAL